MEFEEPVIFEQIEIAKVTKPEIIAPITVFEGVQNTENIPPPPYDDYEDGFF